MTLLEWTSVLIIISSAVSLYWLIKKSIESSDVTLGLFSFSLILLIVYSIVFLFKSYLNLSSNIFNWIQLSIYLIIASGLFSFIRDLKPKFSKFPLYLVFLPLLTMLFYPLVMENRVISDLIFASYQAGCIIVGLLLYSLVQHKHGSQILQISAAVLFGVSFITFWLLEFQGYNSTALSEVILSFGIFLTGKGINNQTNDKSYR